MTPEERAAKMFNQMKSDCGDGPVRWATRIQEYSTEAIREAEADLRERAAKVIQARIAIHQDEPGRCSMQTYAARLEAEACLAAIRGME